MKEVLRALKTKLKAEVSGATNVYFTVAPSTAVFPYIVYRLITATYDGTFTEDEEDMLFQFNIYSEDPEPDKALDIWQEINTALNEKELTITDYGLISMTRLGEPYIINRWEENGKQVWDVMTQYRIIVGNE